VENTKTWENFPSSAFRTAHIHCIGFQSTLFAAEYITLRAASAPNCEQTLFLLVDKAQVSLTSSGTVKKLPFGGNLFFRTQATQSQFSVLRRDLG
jgi:hypothetical protein